MLVTNDGARQRRVIFRSHLNGIMSLLNQALTAVASVKHRWIAESLCQIDSVGKADRLEVRVLGENTVNKESGPVTATNAAALKHQVNGFKNCLRVVSRVLLVQPHQGDGKLVRPRHAKSKWVEVVLLGIILKKPREIFLKHGVSKVDETVHSIDNALFL